MPLDNPHDNPHEGLRAIETEIPDSARARVQAASEEDLDRWTTGIFAAETVEALLRG